jgi:uncharacterized membrane protein (DUF4010 family)
MTWGFDRELVGVFAAALGGAAVGLERQWSGHAKGARARFAGIRTFTMLGGLGGVAGWMWAHEMAGPALVTLFGAVAIIAVAYLAASKADVDATTEIAALVVVAAGMLSGLGSLRIGSAVVALTGLLLVEKSRLHRFAEGLDDESLRAGIRFAVMACVVLPILPTGPFTRFEIRPRELWALVLFFSGLSFVGYVARNNLGPKHGYLATGLVGGLFSSTNVTLTFARASRKEPVHDWALAFGAVAANAMLFPRVLTAIAVLRPELVRGVAWYFAAPAVIAVTVALIGLRVKSKTSAESRTADGRSPLQLKSALQMAALFQFVLIAVPYFSKGWGTAGLWSSAALLGLTDVDALTVSIAKGSGITGDVAAGAAASAIAIGVLSNTLLKTAIAAVLGDNHFRLVAGGTLAAMAAALGAVIWFH